MKPPLLNMNTFNKYVSLARELTVMRRWVERCNLNNLNYLKAEIYYRGEYNIMYYHVLPKSCSHCQSL